MTKYSLIHLLISGKKIWITALLFSLTGLLAAQTNSASDTDLKKKADKFFNAEDYEPAMPLYSQLLSLYPKDPVYNYRYGVCLVTSGKEKVNSIAYLEFASTQENIDADVWYYLGRAYMIAGNFQSAQKAFANFKSNGSSFKVKKFETDLLILNCSNAEELLKSRRNVAVVDAREVSRNNFYLSFDFSEANGKLIPTAEQFLTGMDKDMQLNPVMFMARDGQIIYYSSYGKNSKGGKDIFLRRKMTNGQWADPENLGDVVNTAENEDFPVLDRDGRTLYFSSRGHNSIGGYDLYKTQFDFNTGKWSEPQNLGIPINTVEDDFLYLPSLKGDRAGYATVTDAGKRKIQIRTIQLGDISNNLVSISGTYFSLDQVTRRDARVTVLRTSDHGIITSVRTDPRSGKYELVLEGGQEYTLVVEGGSYLPHAENFTLPSLSGANLRQEVKLNKTKEKEEMILVNFFTPLTASGDPAALAVSDVPTETISKEYELSAGDTSGKIPVKIDNETVYVAPPSAIIPGKQESVHDPVSDRSATVSQRTEKDQPEITEQITELSEDTNEALAGTETDTKKEKYDPYQEKPITPDEIKQKKEEESRTLEVVMEEKGKVPEIDVNVSNEDLAKLAFDDARTIEEDAANLKKEAAALRTKAIAKDSIAEVLKNESVQFQVKDQEKSQVLLSQSEESHSEAVQLSEQALALEEQSAQRSLEAKTALEDARQIVLSASQSNTVAQANTGKKGKSKSSGNTVSGTQPSESQSAAVSFADESKMAVNKSKEETGILSDTSTPGKPDNTNAEEQNAGITPESAAGEKSTEPVAQTIAGAADENVALKAADKIPENKPVMEVQSSSQPEVRDANLSQQAKYDDGVRHENNLVAGKTEKETKDSEQAKKTENAEIALAGNTEQKSEPQVVVPFPAEGASPSDQVVKTVVRNNEEKNSKGMDSGKPDGSETVPSIAGESEHEGHSQNAAIPNNAKSGTTLSGQDEKKAVKSRESLDSETGSTNELAGKQKNDSEPSPVNIDPALSVNSGKPVGNKPGKPDSKNEVKESITTVPSVSGKETKNDSGGDSGNTESSTKTNPSNTSGTGNSTSTESAATPVRTTNIPVSKQASQQNSSVQNITEIPTVPQEALVAYKGYENKLTQSRVLAGQSERLQERVASMKISPVRDSLIEVSNSLSRESIKDWQDAQRQLADAKRIDPEIEVKVKEFTSQEPRLAVVSPASGDERSVPEGTAKSNEIATTENSGKEKKVSTTKDQYIPEKNVKTPPRSVEIQPEVQGTLAVDNPLVTQNRQTDADKNTNSPLSSTATQQEKKTEVKDDLIISEPTTIINTETKKEEDLKPKLTGTHDQVIAQKTAETSLNQNDGVLKTENQVSKGGITSKTENQTAAVKTTDTVDGNTFAGRKDSAPTDKVDQKNMTVVEETGVKNEAKTEQKSAESNSIPIPAQSELPEIVKDNSASTELLSKETGTTQPNSKSPTREQVSTTRKVSDQNQSAPSGAVPVQNTSGIENNAFPSETKTITGIQHPDAISEPGQSGVSAAEKDVAVTGKSPEAGNVRDQVMNERRSDSTEKNVALPGNSGKTPAIVTEGTSGNQQNNLSAVAAEKSIAMNNTVRKTDQHNPEGQAGNQPESNAGEVTTGNSNVQPVPASEQLDTTREEYPRYVKIQKDINTAQVETITIFASAVNMNKLAVEEKQKQLDLLDEADKTTDENKKIKLIKEAEKLGKSSRKNEMLSRQKFTEAQQKTSDVKVLTWQLEAVKSKLVIPNGQTQTTVSGNQLSTSGTRTEQSMDNQTMAASGSAGNKDNADFNNAAPAGAARNAESGNRNAIPSLVMSSEEKEAMAVEVFSRSPRPVYTAENPIPMNPSLPEGLVFKVQVGAFHKPIPDQTFKNLQPVSGETTRPGWIRYCVGMFKTFEPANIVKKELRKNGFKDAFVVAYYNGVRVSLNEAYAILHKPGSELQAAYNQQSAKEIALLNSMKIVDVKIPAATGGTDEDAQQFYGGATANSPAASGSESETVMYAVQVGVYRNAVPPSLLNSLQPLYTEPMAKGLYRFTNGRYNYFAEADSAKRIAVNTGVKDAFIIVYRNGRRISLASLGKPSASSRPASLPAVTSVRHVSEALPATTPEPGAAPRQEISGKEGIVFKVQLGAFKNNVPYQWVETFLKITDKGITQETDPRGLHIFYAGSFTEYAQAMELKQEVVEKGVNDAFIVALQNGRRITISEALNLLRN